MIKFKQKEFLAPLVAGAGRLAAQVLPSVAIEGGLGLAANKAQEKANAQQTEIMEKQAEQQAEANKDIQRTLDKIAESAKSNPQGAVQAAGQALQQKQYANLGRVLKKDVGGFAKDIGKSIWKRRNLLIGGTLAGGAMAASSYAADKAVQLDMKRSGIPLQKINKPETVQKQYSGFAKSAIAGVKKYGGKVGRVIGEAAKENKGMIITTSALGALPIVAGYASEKQQLKDQVNATKNSIPSQKSYSILSGVGKSLGRMGRKMKAGWWKFKKHPGQSVLGWVSNNIGQGGGRKDVMDFGRELEQRGIKSGSRLSQKAGKFIYTHPKTSLVGSTAVGMGAMGLTWGKGESAVKGLIKKVDKDGYAYQESKDQEVQ